MPKPCDVTTSVASPARAAQATFEAGLSGLLRLAAGNAAPPSALFPAAARAHALLKARYSNPSWLRLGSRLLSALLAAEGGLDAAQRAKLEAGLAELRGFLGEEDEGADGGAGPQPQPRREQTLGEMLGFAPPQVGRGRRRRAGTGPGGGLLGRGHLRSRGETAALPLHRNAPNRRPPATCPTPAWSWTAQAWAGPPRPPPALVAPPSC